MPIEFAHRGGVIHTTLVGEVTDEDLLGHYRRDEIWSGRGRYLELVDGRHAGAMRLTADGYEELIAFLECRTERLRGGAVAMVALRSEVYGTFRMWEIMRCRLPYVVHIFDCHDKASAWIERERALEACA